MASYNEILKALIDKTEPVSATIIAQNLNLKVNQINTSLTRMVEKGWLSRDDRGDYLVTEDGRKEMYPITEESEKTTEYQQFITFGQRIGVAPEIVTLTAEHVWRGGNYRDIAWVYKAMMEQGVRADLAKRWWHNWRSYLHQSVPPELEAELGTSAGSKGSAKTTEEEGKPGAGAAAGAAGLRDYILGPDDTPIKVGEGLGDMDYGDAIALSKLKLAANARAAASSGGSATPREQVNFVEAVANAFKTFQDATGGKGMAKPIVITHGKDGVKIQEIEPGAPMVLDGDGDNKEPPKSWVVQPSGDVEEAIPGKPIVIRQLPAAPPGEGYQPPKTFYIHPDGHVEEATPGKPIVIKESHAPGVGDTFINAVTPDGKPFVIDLNSFFKLEDHKAKTRREEESHEVAMDTLKALKDLVVKGGRALSHMEE